LAHARVGNEDILVEAATVYADNDVGVWHERVWELIVFDVFEA
jgi:hypothetical protein